jgi:hypothetical protein
MYPEACSRGAFPNWANWVGFGKAVKTQGSAQDWILKFLQGGRVDAKSSLGDAESSLGNAESSLGDATSSLGDA